MRVHNKLAVSLIIAFIVLFVSMYIKIIPCQTAPVVPNPQYTWAMCDLNPDQLQVGMTKSYLSYTSSIKATYLAILAIVFLVCFTILHFLTREKKK